MEYNILESVKGLFLQQFKETPDVVVKAPGRINLIGEHTDYNLGYCLPAAIDRHIVFGFSLNGTKEANIFATDINEDVVFSVEQLSRGSRLWVDYIKGVLIELEKRGAKISGFNCVFKGDIPIGSGLSSSAALDCGFIKGLSTLFGLELSNWDIVDVSNKSNNDFLDIQSGILDQFSSVFGKAEQCMFLECQSKEYAYHSLRLKPYRLVLINCNVKHDNSSSGYNDRPAECKKLIDILTANGCDVQSLRDVTLDLLNTYKSELTSNLYNRGKFIIEENARVLSFIEAMKSNDHDRLAELLVQSHRGLQLEYEVSCVELDILIEIALKEEGVAGGRMMGGGFGGCTLNLIHEDHFDQAIQNITSAYLEKTGVAATVYPVVLSQGVELLHHATANTKDF